MEAWVHTIVWDGESDQGTLVAGGMYFYKAQVGAFSDTNQTRLLR